MPDKIARKAILEISDVDLEKGRLQIHCHFDPPLKNEDLASPAVHMMFEILDFIKSTDTRKEGQHGTP